MHGCEVCGIVDVDVAVVYTLFWFQGLLVSKSSNERLGKHAVSTGSDPRDRMLNEWGSLDMQRGGKSHTRTLCK